MTCHFSSLNDKACEFRHENGVDWEILVDPDRRKRHQHGNQHLQPGQEDKQIGLLGVWDVGECCDVGDRKHSSCGEVHRRSPREDRQGWFDGAGEIWGANAEYVPSAPNDVLEHQGVRRGSRR